METPGSPHSLMITAGVGAISAQASYQASRLIGHDSLMLIGILAVIGCLVGLGHALTNKHPLPPRRIAGKVLTSVGVSVTAATVYWYQPGTEPVVVIGVGALLSVMGSGWVEEFVRHKTGTSHDESRR